MNSSKRILGACYLDNSIKQDSSICLAVITKFYYLVFLVSFVSLGVTVVSAFTYNCGYVALIINPFNLALSGFDNQLIAESSVAPKILSL
mgnify:CR=1 FL=1